MPALVASPDANLLAAHALFGTGKSVREVAKSLGISSSQAHRLRHTDYADPELIQHASKTVGERLTLVASLATDEALSQGLNGFQVDETKTPAKDLIQIASRALEGAHAQAVASGSNSAFQELGSLYGLTASHTVSRITVESLTVEKNTPQPVVINPHASEKHQ